MAEQRPSRIFTYEEALATFPKVHELTRKAVQEVHSIAAQVGSPEELAARRPEIDSACEEIIRSWAGSVHLLGCQVKGLWLVDWDSGDGYYCWRYPEATLSHFHGYEDGFNGRLPIA
jgi:hypothetical protein